MHEIHNCQNCRLHQTARVNSRCLKGEGGINAPLAIYADHPYMLDDRRSRPFVSEAGELLRWMIRRMSLSLESVYIDYTVKCYPQKLPTKKPERYVAIQACSKYRIATLQSLRPKELIGFGQLSCESLIGKSNVGDYANCWWPPSDPQILAIVPRVWIGYSIGYPLNSPSDSHQQFGLIWMAAEAAGLKPKINDNIKPYKFNI